MHRGRGRDGDRDNDPGPARALLVYLVTPKLKKEKDGFCLQKDIEDMLGILDILT